MTFTYLKQKEMLLYMSFEEMIICNVIYTHVQMWFLILLSFINMYELSLTPNYMGNLLSMPIGKELEWEWYLVGA